VELPAAHTDHDSLLQLSRRVDWRFLLPEPELRRVAIVGSPDPELVRACDVFGESGEPLDVLVARGAPSPHALQRLRRGGWLYAEFEGVGAAVHARRAAAALARRGFRIQVHWHRPSFAACEEIVPLDDRDALRLALARQERAARAKATIARLLLASRLLPLALPAVSVLAQARGESSGTRERRILVTPRFRASRHVVSLVLGEDGEPAFVAKTPRLRGDDEGVERECAALRALEAAGRGETVPRVVSFEERWARRTLAMTAVRGRPLNRADVRRDRNACLEPVRRWVLDLAGLGGGSLDQAGYERLVERPLRRVAAELPELAQLVEETLALVLPLRESSVAHAFEHGDLGEPNLIWLGGGEVGLVDWELAEPLGLPLHDLCFFLAYAAFAEARAVTTAAFDAAFAGGDSWAAREVAHHADSLGLPRGLITPLFVACWARYAAGLLGRLSDGGVSAELSTWLGRSNRFFALWEHTVAHAREFDWPTV
jgi:hypothetical protein